VDKHTISIYPVGYSGEIFNSAKARPIVLDAWYPFDAEGKDKFKDPLFLRQLYVQLNQPNYASQKFPSFAFIVDGNYSNPTYMTYRDISSAYNTITKNPNWKLADKNTAINQLNKKIKDIDTKLNPETKGYADLSQAEKNLNKLKGLGYTDYDMSGYSQWVKNTAADRKLRFMKDKEGRVRVFNDDWSDYTGGPLSLYNDDWTLGTDPTTGYGDVLLIGQDGNIHMGGIGNLDRNSSLFS
jgi:hypothetical protein